MDTWQAKAAQNFTHTRALRRDFHQHPELGFDEFRTAEIVAAQLNQLGLSILSGVAKTGVVGILDSGKPGLEILLRFDMDALPVQETNEVDYASQTAGVMHACGHDGHIAVGLTVAKILSEVRDQLRGRIRFIFQPAEEGLGGAERMIAEGILEDPEPDVALAIHMWNEREVGWVAIAPGPVMAGAEVFSIEITGKGGHGALPQQTKDPVVAAAHMITSLQTIVSRNVSPLKAAVVTVASINAGEAFNVIPQTVTLKGTIRSFEEKTRQVVLARLGEIVSGTALAMGCQAEVSFQHITPALVNDPKITGTISSVVRHHFPELTIENQFQTMGSEDMAFVLEKIPGCYLFIGSANTAKGLNYGHHHPRFDFDEQALEIGTAVLCAAVFELTKA